MTSYTLQNNNLKALKIRAFKASENKPICIAFLNSHKRELRKIGVKKLDSSMPDWINRDDVYVIIVQDVYSKRFLAGAKIEVASHDRRLPIQRVLMGMTDEIDKFISRKMNSGICEMTGLWIGDSLRKKNFIRILTCSCLAILKQISIDTVLVLSSQFTINTCLKAGFEINSEFGDNGMFLYPTPNFKTFIATLHDTIEFNKANDDYRDSILGLVNNPKTTRIENHDFLIEYNLDLTYEEVEENKSKIISKVKPTVRAKRI